MVSERERLTDTANGNIPSRPSAQHTHTHTQPENSRCQGLILKHEETYKRRNPLGIGKEKND